MLGMNGTEAMKRADGVNGSDGVKWSDNANASEAVKAREPFSHAASDGRKEMELERRQRPQMVVTL
jgi:hypothetical protein